MPQPNSAEDIVPADEIEAERERIKNDVANTSVMAALVGGFALSSLQRDFNFETRDLDAMIYVCCCLATHACTCSALTSAFVYRSVNNLPAPALLKWTRKYQFIIRLPLMKFVCGSLAYLLTVILNSWEDLQPVTTARWMALMVGAGGMSTAVLTTALILWSTAAASREVGAGDKSGVLAGGGGGSGGGNHDEDKVRA